MMAEEASREHKPLVSVIMPAYNAEQYIAKAIQSVQNQTASGWELIVLDDCSDDATVQVVAERAQRDSRIRLYQNKQNMGVAQSRNRGLELCRGDYVAFLDSDDAWYPEKLEIQLNWLQQTRADLVYTAYSIADAAGKILCEKFEVPRSIDFRGLLKENVIGCSTVMISREMAKKNRFPTNVYHEDYVLWLEMLRSGCKAVGVQQVLMEYCFRGSSKSGNKLKAASRRWQIYRCYLGLSLMKSAWFFAHYALAGMRKYRKIK